MVRTASVDENGLKKGLWSQEEDHKLRSYMMQLTHFPCNWRKLPKLAGLSRCGKSCRLRWMNYLRPDVRRGNFSKEEDDLIVQLHQQLGNKWSRIAMELPGRTDNEIKNHWHTHLKKQTQKTHNQLPTTSITQNRKTEITPTKQSPQPQTADASGPFSPVILESSPVSNSSSVAENSSGIVYEDSAMDFWTQPFLTDDCYNYTQHDYISSYNSYYGDTADWIEQVLYENHLQENH